MNDFDGQDSEFTDDEVRITDLDPLDSPQHKRAAFIARVVTKGLATRWIRYGLSSALLLILLGALILQWPRPTPMPANAPSTPPRFFLNATSAQSLLFVQASDFTLTAYQVTTWRARWHTRLPALANLQAQGQMIFCNFVTPDHKTVLEALDSHTGKVIWHDDLPKLLTTNFQVSRGQLTPAFEYSDNTLFAQSTNNAVYAIQASSGRINWTYQAHDAPPANSGNLPAMSLFAQDGVVEFMSTEAVVHVLDVATGREILSSLSGSFSWPLVAIDGQMIYTLPPPGGPVPTIQAFHIPDGQRLWTYTLPKNTWAQNESDGIIYLGADAGATLIALRGSDGHQLWRYTASDDQPVNNTFFVQQGVGYLLQQDATLVSMRVSDGHVLWRAVVTDFAGRINPTTYMLLDNGVILLRDQEPDSSLPIDVISPSDGHLLWRSPEPIANPYVFAGALYTIANNGQLDAWRESDGRHIWSFDAPIGSSIVWSLQSIPGLLFLQDTTGHLYALRTTDGKLLWRYL